MIKFPVTVKKTDDARFAYLVDADGRILFGGGSLEDAEQLVAAANAGANLKQPIVKPERRRNKREQIREELKNSDPLAQLMDRKEIVYGLPDELPQCGESVARLGKG